MRIWLALTLFAGLAEGQRLSEFLTVKSWQGEITIKADNSGVASFAGVTDTWNVSWSGDLKVQLDTFNSNGLYWTGKFTSGSMALRHKDVSVSGDCTTTITQEAQGLPQPTTPGGASFFLYVGPKDTYTFVPVAKLTGTATTVIACPGNTGTQKADGALAWWVGDWTGMGNPFGLPAAGLALSGNGTYHYDFPLGVVAYVVNQNPPSTAAQITWSFQPGSSTQYDLVVEPTDYANWRPTAAVDGSKGNSIDVKATLKTKDGSPVPQGAGRFVWQLTNCSKEPGWAMNAPVKDAKNDFDMKFEAGNDLVIDDAKGQHGFTPPQDFTKGITQATATVGSYDWGGFSTIKVTAEMPDGQIITGHLINDDQQTEVRLPKRDPNSSIARGWLEQRGVVGMSDNADYETDPMGDGSPGDGLTLYEEYRGFYENGQHIEGNVQKKDYFIRNKIGGTGVPGIKFFARLTGLAVHYQFQDSEMGDDRVMNRNHDAGPHRVDQHGVVLTLDPTMSGYMEASGGPGPPGQIQRVRVPGGGQTSILVAQGGLFTYLNISLAHELLHACNVYHHGEGGFQDVTWRRIPETRTVMENDTYEVDVRSEPLAALSQSAAIQVPIGGEPVRVGQFSGVYSGDDQCVMRYDDANAYPLQAAPSVRISVREVPGRSICTAPAGTGVNDSGHVPQSRYGDAADGRGNCAAQILVNDAVTAPQR